MRLPARRSAGVRRTVALALVTPLVVALAACGADSDDTANASSDAAGTSSTEAITVYSGQHEEFAKALAEGFTAKTGIKVDVRAGEDAELTSQIVTEGAKSPADVLLTEEPGPMASLAQRGLFAPVDQETLDKVPARFRADDKSWIGIAARARVVIFNPDKIAETDLPKSVLDLADPRWKGKFAYAPSGAFIGTVTYLRATLGEDKTKSWLEGIKANGTNLKKNGAIRDAVEAGQMPFGLINHYYWFLQADQVGADAMKSKLHYIGHDDPGALVFPSGAAVLKSSKHQAEAQKFVAYLVAPDGGQKIIADTTPQYPVATDAPANPKLKPLDELGAPAYDPNQLADQQGSIDLLTELGML
jgi:iron(III) transport system substrate-binding protein